MNQAVMDRKVNPFEVLRAQITGDLKGNVKIVQARWVFGFIGGDPNECAFGGQFALF